MALYRALARLEVGKGHIIERGEVFPGDILGGALGVLEKRGKVAPAGVPPLEILPGWKLRSEKLRALGIVDVGGLVEADARQVAEAVGVKPATVDKWKSETLAWLVVDRPQGC